jgi:hypothetical protein
MIRICEIYEGQVSEPKTLIGQFQIEIDSTTDIIRMDIDLHSLQIKICPEKKRGDPSGLVLQQCGPPNTVYEIDSSLIEASNTKNSSSFDQEEKLPLVEFDRFHESNIKLFQNKNVFVRLHDLPQKASKLHELL